MKLYWKVDRPVDPDGRKGQAHERCYGDPKEDAVRVRHTADEGRRKRARGEGEVHVRANGRQVLSLTFQAANDLAKRDLRSEARRDGTELSCGLGGFRTREHLR